MTSSGAESTATPGARPPAASARLRRGLCALTIVALCTFVVSLTLAALAYPGGSWTETRASGFSLLRNFWCDLLRSEAHNGAPNALSQWLSSVAFAALGVGLGPYWLLAASLLGRRGARLVAWLGVASALGLAATGLLPSDRFPVLHGAVALSGGLAGMWAAFVSVRARLTGEPRDSARRVFGAGALLLALINAGLYVYVAYAGGEETVLQPLVQKFATAALLAWMGATVRVAWLEA